MVDSLGVGEIATVSPDQSRKPQQQQQSMASASTGKSAQMQDQVGRDRSARAQLREQVARGHRGFSDEAQGARLREQVDRAWGNRGSSDNRDYTRADDYSNKDNPYKRFCDNYGLYRTCPDVAVRRWSTKPRPCGPLSCLLCPEGQDFTSREAWLEHLNEHHGGRQRYRDAYLSLAQLAPYIVSGQEWRVIVANFSEFYSRSARDWEKFTPEMQHALASGQGLPAELRWRPRQRTACVFCARSHWLEELHEVFLAGAHCFMQHPQKVWKMLSVARYEERWPLIAATGELRASSVKISTPDPKAPRKMCEHQVLLHKRRVAASQAAGEDAVYVCGECKEAFEGTNPWLCKYALANDMWLGRWDPLFRDANLAHQMLLALARIVTTKIVLRPDGSKSSDASSTNSWDFLFHQSGIIGTAILFQNADCGKAMQHFPPDKINDSFAVSFVADVKGDANGQQQSDAKAFVASEIAKLKVHRMEFDAQSEALVKSNVVYKDKTYRRDLVATWVPDPKTPAVPSVITDAVVAVPLEESPGHVVAEGPADATAMGEAERMDADVAAARDARYIAAFEPEVQDLNGGTNGGMEVTALMQQLEELDRTAQRSVAAEVESAVESRLGTAACLVDEAGRERILEICDKVRKSCARIDDAEKKLKLQLELQKTATGQQEWQAPSSREAAKASSGQLAHLLQPRSSTPLSYWDWRIWTMARPTLWRFGDAANLYTDREVPLTVAKSLCRVESTVLQRDSVLSFSMRLSFALR